MTSSSPLDLVKTIRVRTAEARHARDAANASDDLDTADSHWEAFDAAVTPLIDALIAAEDRQLLPRLEALLTTLQAQVAESVR